MEELIWIGLGAWPLRLFSIISTDPFSGMGNYCGFQKLLSNRVHLDFCLALCFSTLATITGSHMSHDCGGEDRLDYNFLF